MKLSSFLLLICFAKSREQFIARAMSKDIPVIRCHELAACRNQHVLTARLSFAASAGEYVQLRGPNGIGKSTVLRHLAGLTPYEPGQIFVHDEAVTSHDIPNKLDIAYLGHDDGLHPDLTAYENFELLTDLPRQMLVQRDYYNRPVGTFSAGQRKYFNIQMLSDECDIWLLDEPSASLDGPNRQYLEERMAGFLALGGVIVAITHDELAETLVSEVVSIRASESEER